MAIPVVEATGTNYEIGYEMGRHAKSALHKIVVNLARFKQLKNDWGNSRRLNELMAKTKATFPDYYQELQGISDGSEMTLEDIFLWKCHCISFMISTNFKGKTTCLLIGMLPCTT